MIDGRDKASSAAQSGNQLAETLLPEITVNSQRDSSLMEGAGLPLQKDLS